MRQQRRSSNIDMDYMPLQLIVANHIDLYLPLVEDTRTTRSVSMKIRTTVNKHATTLLFSILFRVMAIERDGMRVMPQDREIV